MGSDNNMVAVPDLSSGYGAVFDRASAIVECTKIVNADPIAALARLASTQTDAQQGEEDPEVAFKRDIAEKARNYFGTGAQQGELDICPQCSGSGVGSADTVCTLCNGSGGVPFTPPSPALDAATIERAGQALVDAWCREQSLPPIGFAPDELNTLVTAVARALPKAEKRHG